jgi:hypothetical protein
MNQPLGYVRQVARYPIKSMAGTFLETAFLGWHGLLGDRRFAFRRLDDRSGFPWLTASRLPELLCHQPFGLEEGSDEPLPTHVRTPDGRSLELGGADLPREINRRFGAPVELMKIKHGVFDDSAVSVITDSTVDEIGRESGMELDRRRFRANIVVETVDPRPFAEDEWVGGTLVFGRADGGPAVAVTARDLRCVMINLNPDTAAPDDRVLKAVARRNGSHAGVYGAVVRVGELHVGDPVRLVPPLSR